MRENRRERGEKMERKRNEEEKKNGRDEMGKSANVCIWVEEKKMEEEMREPTVVCGGKKCGEELRSWGDRGSRPCGEKKWGEKN